MRLSIKIPMFFLLICILATQIQAKDLGRLPLTVQHLQQEPSLSLNQNIWLIDPDPMDSARESLAFSYGTHPKDFISQPSFRPGSESATFRITIELDQPAALSILIPEYPFYELYLGDRLLVKHGNAPDQPQRLYRELALGEGTAFPLVLKVRRFHDFWPPYTGFKVGISSDLAYRQQLAEFYGAFFLGILVITALYHLSLSIIIPQNKPSLHFAIFLVCLGLRASLSDVEQILIRIQPNFSWEWSWKLGFIGYYGALPAALSYTNQLFPKTVPRFSIPLVCALSFMMVGLTLVTDVAFYARLTQYFHFCTLFALSVSLIGFARAYRRKMSGVKPFLGGIVIMSAAVINDVFLITNLLESTPLIEYAILAFIFSQTAIISYNYANAFHDIVHAHKQLQKLVYEHVVTQIAGGKILEETMPVGTREAVVLAFDVIGSSRIKHPHFNRTLERVMARCQEILHEAYDPETVSARGYRIKEMGDGLLASIGFPLGNPGQESNADTAIKIAMQFCEMFQEEMEKLSYHEAIYCSVGVAQGMIEGFFPKSGIKQYDVRGRPLILANRYESMRNIVFKETGAYSSLIFIQDAVYKSLSAELQDGFQLWDCTQRGHRIRDDIQAVAAWYRRMPGASADQGSTIASNDSIGPGPRAVS